MELFTEEQSPVSLLYVEDDKGTQKMVVSMLRAKFPHLNLQVADDGEMGLELFRSHRPDIVLTDLMMPGKDGIQMSREIKGIDRDAQIVVLTAAADKDSILDAIDSGINHYVMKPVVMGKLVASVRRCIDEVLLRRQVRQQEASMRRMAYYDPLTGLPNRLLFNELLRQALAQAQRQGWNLAVLFLDLDRFKTVNDTLGHAVGDLLLQAVAHRLRECCRRDQDVVARRGGDEFTILLSDPETSHEAARMAQIIIDAFSAPIVLPEHEIFISPSIGISVFPQDGISEDDLIKNADIAMYSAKEEGRNRYHLFNPSMNKQTQEKLAVETGLRAALQRDELLLRYQPNLDLESGRVVSIEALVRWQHPELGLIEPARFITVAEETGLILPLTEWVLRTACSQNRKWQEIDYPPMRVAVNVPPRQFQSVRFAELVERVLSETGLAPRWLELEVAEEVLQLEMEKSDAAMRRLSELGVHLTIDKFGTGFTSLARMKKLPITTVKINRSFVEQINSNTDNAAIATAVISMAQSLGLNVVGEGVEGEGQLDFLRSHNCAKVQGYFFCKPLLAGELSELLASPRWQELIRQNRMVQQAW